MAFRQPELLFWRKSAVFVLGFIQFGEQHQVFVQLANGCQVFVGVVQIQQEVANAIQTSAFFVVRFDNRPRGVARVGVEKHVVFGGGVVVPTVKRLNVNRRQFPMFQWVVATADKAAGLLIARYGKPKI